jgi:hypothetical protein
MSSVSLSLSIHPCAVSHWRRPDPRACSDDESKQSTTNLNLLGCRFWDIGSRNVIERFEEMYDAPDTKLHSIALDFDTLLSDAIDAVLGKR